MAGDFTVWSDGSPVFVDGDGSMSIWADGSPSGVLEEKIEATIESTLPSLRSSLEAEVLVDGEIESEIPSLNSSLSGQGIFFEYDTRLTRIEARLDGVWTDISPWWLHAQPLDISIGILGFLPTDNLARTGTCEFTLVSDDDAQWSPSRADAVPDWKIGTPIRVVFVPVSGSERIRFLGKVAFVLPEAGEFGSGYVTVVAHDIMGQITEAMVREISSQIDVNERDLVDAVFAALAALESPIVPDSVDFDPGVVAMPYAFDDIGEEATAGGLLKDALDSSFAAIACYGTGRVVMRNSESRTFTESVATFEDKDLKYDPASPTVPSDLATSYSRVVARVPQIRKGELDEVLASAEGQDDEGVLDGETVELFLTYRDSSSGESRPPLIGGDDMVALSPGTDYEFNTQPDGLGVDVTADVDVVASFFAGSVKLEITNNSGGTAYRIILQARGRALRRFDPIVVQSSSAQPYGARTLTLTTPYSTSLSRARFQVDYVQSQLSGWKQRPTLVKIEPHSSTTMMAQALLREPLDRITIRELKTGLDADAVIQSVTLRLIESRLECEWSLAPQSSLMFISPWLLGIASRSELGETTVLG